ncbi:MAG: Asp-tRNA(Asn)/Glu-tRNA(Gln) amidotransferase subunit GatC [Candidatus Micrarchaeia archaeon]
MDKDTILKVAMTARLHLTDEEIDEMLKDIEKILQHFAAIKDIRTEGEMYYVHDFANPLRQDGKGQPDDAFNIRDQFTRKEGRYLSAPKTIK